MDDLLALRRSPLAHLSDQLAATGGESTVRLREVPYLSSFEVRGDPAGPAMARLGAALFGGSPPGSPWPECGRTVGADSRYVLWCGPGWYLVVDEPASALAEAIDGAIGADLDVSVVDVSAGRTVLELTGQHARDVLAHGCAIDLHPRVFGPGSCVQTTLAKAQVILHQTGAGPGRAATYRVLVRASYADYLARWLLDATVEYVVGADPTRVGA
jgi:sarcosine oxidase subunit gamma